MGMNTTVVIYNDALSQIEKDRNFGKKLADAIRNNGCACTGPVQFFAGHAPAGVVVETHHADFDVLVLVGGNTGEDMGIVYPQGDESKEVRVARSLAEENGYHLRRNPTKR